MWHKNFDAFNEGLDSPIAEWRFCLSYHAKIINWFIIFIHISLNTIPDNCLDIIFFSSFAVSKNVSVFQTHETFFQIVFRNIFLFIFEGESFILWLLSLELSSSYSCSAEFMQFLITSNLENRWSDFSSIDFWNFRN